MAKSKAINGNKKVLAALTRLMKELDQKYSIRVGIIGEQAYEKHPHTDLTNAHLGAIHEFGATINVTPKMRAWLHYQGIHLKPETNTITIPARSFLRDTLLSPGSKKELLASVFGESSKDLNFAKSQEAMETYFKEASKRDIFSKGYSSQLAEQFLKDLIPDIAELVGSHALTMVQQAFEEGGHPTKWAPITEFTKKHRIGDPNNPPLDSTGVLKDRISYDVRKVK